MSILHTFNGGWVVSHEGFVRDMYSHVSDGQKTVKFQLKQVLFEIVCPYRKPENDTSSSGLKRKRKIKTAEVRNSNFDELESEVQLVKCSYEDLCKECDVSGLFEAANVVSQSNKPAQDAADECSRTADSICLLNAVGSNGNESVVKQLHGSEWLFPSDCRFYCKDVSEIGQVLRDEMFDVIVMDPPWWNKYIRRKNAGGGGQGYGMMRNPDLGAVPVGELLAPDGLLAIWCTNAPQHHADLVRRILPRWGLRPVAKWYWLKVTRSGQPVCTFGAPPAKQPFEQLVLAARSSGPRPPPTRLLVSVPSALHSHKPPLARLLEPHVAPHPRCLELFARYLLPGWTSWGLQVAQLQHRAFYERR